MDISQFSAIRLLRLAMLAALVLPVILFLFLAVTNYRDSQYVADQRIERTVNILHEHGLKVFETVERAIAETNEVVRGMSDDEIRANEKRLHERLRDMVVSLPQLKSLWIFGSDGRALVNSLIYPNPNVDFSDRDYFRAHVDKDSGLFFGQVLRPRQPYPDGEFFSVSRRRPSDDGSFRGVVQVSMRPEYLEQFYGKLQSAYPGGYAAMVRQDGEMLARYPAHVRKDKIANFVPATIEMEKQYRRLSASRPAPFAWQAEDLHASGAIGDATQASAEKGEQLLQYGAKAFCELLDDMHHFDVTVFDREPDAGA